VVQATSQWIRMKARRRQTDTYGEAHLMYLT
jgi:hypothetical protein